MPYMMHEVAVAVLIKRFDFPQQHITTGGVQGPAQASWCAQRTAPDHVSTALSGYAT